MKRILCVLLILCLLPFTAVAQSDEARELTVIYHNSADKETDAAPLQDGDDTTGLTLKKDKQGIIGAVIAEEDSCSSIYVRLNEMPRSVELQQLQDRRWNALMTVSEPGLEFVLPVGGISGTIRLVLSFETSVSCTVLEMRLFADGALPEELHPWQTTDTADILLAVDVLDQVDQDLVLQLTQQGYQVAVVAMSCEGEKPAACDRLWTAGLRIAPAVWNGKPNEGEKALSTWLRTYQPMLLITDGTLTDCTAAAEAHAVDPAWDVDSAAARGLWVLPDRCTVNDDVTGKAAAMRQRSSELVRAACEAKFAAAEHADPAQIPYPERDADGYLPQGEPEFIFEDPDNGLWAYVSQTLQVEIVRYHMPQVPHTWFEADVIFKPEAEQLTQHTYVNATFVDQQIYPETLAQTSQLVFAINGDYYPYRVNKKMAVGNIVRRGQALYSFDPNRTLKYPNLDTIALHDDGSVSVCAGGETTAEELVAQGDVHDALSFGPYLARDGQLRIFNGDSALVAEPRSALGMKEPGHLFFVMVEGKMPKKGEQGMGLVELAQLMYARGVTDACNVDGGSTAVMLFMGRKLNRTGKGSSVGSPRNQHELFGIGSSTQVHTDMVNGK